MSLGGGDKLARGASSAQFTVSEGVSQAKWDAIFAPEKEKPATKKQPKLKTNWSR